MMEKKGWELERLVNEQRKAPTSGGVAGRLLKNRKGFPAMVRYIKLKKNCFARQRFTEP